MHQTKVPIWNLDIYGMTCYKSEHSSNQAQKAAQAPKHVVRNDVSKASVDTGTTQALWHHALLLHEKARLELLRRMPQGRLSATVGRARKTKARQWRDLGDISFQAEMTDHALASLGQLQSQSLKMLRTEQRKPGSNSVVISSFSPSVRTRSKT